jgi:hypothetical protein
LFGSRDVHTLRARGVVIVREGFLFGIVATSTTQQDNSARNSAGGADDGATNRTPSAWMISLAIFLAHGQIVFFVWVTFGERKWSILAERRRPETR